MDRLCLIDPETRGGSVNRLSSTANPKGGLCFVITFGANPNLRAFSRLLPLCLYFAAAVLFVRLLLSRKNRFVANTKHMAGFGWAQRRLALLGYVPPLLSSSSCCPALHTVKQRMARGLGCCPKCWVLPILNIVPEERVFTLVQWIAFPKTHALSLLWLLCSLPNFMKVFLYTLQSPLLLSGLGTA